MPNLLTDVISGMLSGDFRFLCTYLCGTIKSIHFMRMRGTSEGLHCIISDILILIDTSDPFIFGSRRIIFYLLPGDDNAKLN